MGSRDERITVPGHLRKKFSDSLSQKTSQVWWCTSVMPTMQEAEVGGLQQEADLSKKLEPLFDK
jgi:hypothetical protein